MSQDELIITVWSRNTKQEDGTFKYEHNHISDGYDPEQQKPIGITIEQTNQWKNGEWKKYKAKLVQGKVLPLDNGICNN